MAVLDEIWFWDKPYPNEYDATGAQKIIVDGKLQLVS